MAFGLANLGRLSVDHDLVEETGHLTIQMATLVALQCAKHLGRVKVMVGRIGFEFGGFKEST